jgi:hypothetical protein
MEKKMYSVFKALKKDCDPVLLNNIEKAMKDIKNGNFCEIKNGFVSDISKSYLWFEQQKEMIVFLKLFEKQIKDLVRNKYDVFIDLAIYQDDVVPMNCGLFLHNDIELLKLLGDLNVEYEISIYKH